MAARPTNTAGCVIRGRPAVLGCVVAAEPSAVPAAAVSVPVPVPVPVAVAVAVGGTTAQVVSLSAPAVMVTGE